MNRMKLWPHGVLIILACALVGGAAALLWNKYERTAQAKELPNAARIERVEGQVGINQSLDNATSSQWTEATANMPVSVGDRIYTKENSKSEIAFTGRNFATVDANTALDILDLSNRRTQVAIRDGGALFDVGSISSGDTFEVATPCGAIDLEQPGVYQIAVNDNGIATATALSGEAQIVGQGGAGRIDKGEYLTVPCQGSAGSAPAVLSRVDANQAGSVIDSYYRYRYPRRYDGRYRNYYTYLDDPYYYDPYRRGASYNYVSEYVPGVDDLDDYGDWQYVSDYGYCWHPRVDTGWAPYQAGYWSMDYPFGLTWVSNEPWGYAPYHYGRWAYSSNEWFWVPEGARTYPTYSPALVAFLPLGPTSVAWVPLGPSDPYISRYYDPNWQPVYLNQSNVVVERIVNINAPGAVTVVPAQDFTRVIDPRFVTRVDPRTIAEVRPVLDPLTVDPLRRVAFQSRDARPRIDLPQPIAQRIANTPVVAGTAPVAPPFRRDLARALRVEALPDRVKNQRLQFQDQRAGVTGRQQVGNGAQTGQQPNLASEQARERQMADLSRQAARGDRNARQQIQQLRGQQVEQRRLEGAQVQGERVGQPMPQQQGQREALRQQQQAQRDAARQQMINSQQQRRAAPPQQIQSQRRQTEMRRAPENIPRAQPEMRRLPQPQAQPRPQPPPRMERPQVQAQPRPQAERQQKPPPARTPEQTGNGKKKP